LPTSAAVSPKKLFDMISVGCYMRCFRCALAAQWSVGWHGDLNVEMGVAKLRVKIAVGAALRSK
jgi:hypothetical protein